MPEELPIHLRPGPFMEIMNDALNFDKNSLSYRPTFFALIDILGYKRLLDEFGDDAPRKIFEDILNAFSWARTAHESIRVSLFSDAIVMEGADDSAMNFWNIIQIISSLRLQLLKNGFLIRGAITFGNHFSQKGILVSPALVEAHLLESQQADSPRIIISENALRKDRAELREKKGASGLIIGNYFCKVEARMISTDEDGKNILAFDPNVVELRYLKYGEHPDITHIDAHASHCIEAGNMVLDNISNGIKIAASRADSDRAKSKINYVIRNWNSYIENFKFADKLKKDYCIQPI